MFGTSIVLDKNKTTGVDVILEDDNIDEVIRLTTTKTEKIAYYNNGKVVVSDLKDNILKTYELNQEEKESLKLKFDGIHKRQLEAERKLEERSKKRREEDFISELCADIGDIGWCAF